MVIIFLILTFIGYFLFLVL